MNEVLESLPIVVLYPHSRCNCRCVMCDIWKDTRHVEISAEQFERLLVDFQRLSVQWVVFSGGEPLMHSNLFPMCAQLKQLGIRTTVLTTGLLLERDAAQLVAHVDDIIVSLDGPPAIHDSIRRVPGAFDRLARGVESIHRLRPEFRISARSTVQRQNFHYLRDTARTAKTLGLCSISFLAADVTSTAFHRSTPWPLERQASIALAEEDLPFLDAEIDTLIREWPGDFVAETPEKLRRIANHFRAQLGLCAFQAPGCNAPWVSAVIEADGVVRPCFFHQPIGHTTSGLQSVLNGPTALAFRSSLSVETNPVCQRCVCSLNWRGQ